MRHGVIDSSTITTDIQGQRPFAALAPAERGHLGTPPSTFGFELSSPPFFAVASFLKHQPTRERVRPKDFT